MEKYLHWRFCFIFVIFFELMFFPFSAVKAYNMLNTTLPAETPADTWFVGVGVGGSWIHLPNSTSVSNGSDATPPYDQDYYSIKNFSAQNFQAVIGYRWYQARKYIPNYSVYLQYRHYVSATIRGDIEQYSLPEFENYSYLMRYEADLYTLTGKLDLFEFKKIMPYVSAGVGVITNHLNGYSEAPIPPVTERTNPNFGSSTSNALAATIGLGIDYQITKTILATLGYEHVFQGNIKTNYGADSWSGETLNFGKVKMDSVFFTLSANLPEILRKSST